MNELYHHGVKGMQWGVRKDVASSASKIAITGAKALGEPEFSTPVYKKYDKLTDEELRSRINRLNMEQQYSNLTGDTRYVKSGKEKTRELLQTTGAALAIASTAFGIFETLGVRKSDNK